MLPDVRPQCALLLGYGGGTVAHLLGERFGSFPIVAVDDDPRVLDLAPELNPLPETLELVVGDALAYVAACQGRFDYVALDLFRADVACGGAFTRPFLRRLRQVVHPHGLLAVNLIRDGHTSSRLLRLASLFRLQPPRPIGKNLVVFGQP